MSVAAAAVAPRTRDDLLGAVDWLADSLCDVESDVESEVESLDDSEPLEEAADSEADSDGADSDVDSVADSLAVLPGVSTMLPSVASVFMLAAVTSYDWGVMSDMIYSPSFIRGREQACA